MKVTPTFLYPIFGLETTTTCPGCGLGTKLRQHNFVVVPRFTTREARLRERMLFNMRPQGHRPVIVKRAVIGSKGGWKLSTIFLSC